jgi:hypothetical protein
MCSERLWLRALTRGSVGAVAIVHLCCEGDHDAVRPILDALSERWAVFKHAKDEAGAQGWYTVEIVGEPTKDSAIEKVATVMRQVDPERAVVTDGDIYKRPT